MYVRNCACGVAVGFQTRYAYFQLHCYRVYGHPMDFCADIGSNEPKEPISGMQVIKLPSGWTRHLHL
jgi:hypothetical protein